MSENGDDHSQQRRRRNRNNNNNNSNYKNSNSHRSSNTKSSNQYDNSDEKELASQLVQIQQKRFYIDVKENPRGRFIKLAEVGVGGRKSRILFSIGAAHEFNRQLAEFIDANAQRPASTTTKTPTNTNVTKTDPDTDNTTSTNPASTSNESLPDKQSTTRDSRERKSSIKDEGLIKSETILKDYKRYYFDLKENQRGTFLRVSMIIMPRGPRAQIAIPAVGLAELRDHLTTLLDKYGGEMGDEADDVNATATQPTDGALNGSPDSKSVRADNKTFYFDIGSNERGKFLKISEVRQNRYRTNITVPDKFINQFRDVLSEFINSTSNENTNNNSNSNAATNEQLNEAKSKSENE